VLPFREGLISEESFPSRVNLQARLGYASPYRNVPLSELVPLYWSDWSDSSYEIYFYSSGGIEEGWTEKQLPVNRANALLGFPLGGLIAAALTVVAAQQLLALQITPQNLGTVLLQALRELGPIGFYAAVIGAFCAIGGATIDSAFSCAYSLAQHQRWPWGKKNGLRQAKRWTAALLGAFGVGYAIVQTRVNPVDLTEYAVIASAVAMPLSFWPKSLYRRTGR
jgi:manganese transport protein